MTREQYIEITGKDPKDMFGQNWEKEIEGYADDGSDLCLDCLGTGTVVEGQHDDVRERKCHCRQTDE